MRRLRRLERNVRANVPATSMCCSLMLTVSVKNLRLFAVCPFFFDCILVEAAGREKRENV